MEGECECDGGEREKKRVNNTELREENLNDVQIEETFYCVATIKRISNRWTLYTCNEWNNCVKLLRCNSLA